MALFEPANPPALTMSCAADMAARHAPHCYAESDRSAADIGALFRAHHIIGTVR
jgi:hypothetical protein